MNSGLGWTFTFISLEFCTHTYTWLVIYKIFRKQCILQDFLHPKLYKTDAKLQKSIHCLLLWSCYVSLLVYALYVVHPNCGSCGNGPLKSLQVPDLLQSESSKWEEDWGDTGVVKHTRCILKQIVQYNCQLMWRWAVRGPNLLLISRERITW